MRPLQARQSNGRNAAGAIAFSGAASAGAIDARGQTARRARLQEPGVHKRVELQGTSFAAASEVRPVDAGKVQALRREKCQKPQRSLCEKWKTKAGFSKEQLERSGVPGRRLRCAGRWHPQCAAPRCKTR